MPVLRTATGGYEITCSCPATCLAATGTPIAGDTHLQAARRAERRGWCCVRRVLDGREVWLWYCPECRRRLVPEQVPERRLLRSGMGMSEAAAQAGWAEYRGLPLGRTRE